VSHRGLQLLPHKGEGLLPHRGQVLLSQRGQELLPHRGPMGKRFDQQTQTNNLDLKNTRSKTNLSREDSRLPSTRSMTIKIVLHFAEDYVLYPRVVISSPFDD
jgi:hypothetical protein